MGQEISEGILYFLKFPLLGLICAFIVVSLRIIYQGMPKAEPPSERKHSHNQVEEESGNNFSEETSGSEGKIRKKINSAVSGNLDAVKSDEAGKTNFDLCYAPTVAEMPAVGSSREQFVAAVRKASAFASAVSGRHLLVDSPYLIETSLPIEQTLIFGRSPECNVCLAGNFVSSRHAKLSIDSSGVVLEDLGSANGTFCNGELLTTPVYLKDGDEFSIDDSKFVYKQS